MGAVAGVLAVAFRTVPVGLWRWAVGGFSVPQLGTQLLVLVVVTGWVIGAMSAMLGLLRRVAG